MLQGEQRTTYLADQASVDAPAAVSIVADPPIPEVEPEDMAGQVAAPDASPPAAVLLMASSLPRAEEGPGVAGDAFLERQQGVPLLRHAGSGAGGAASQRVGG